MMNIKSVLKIYGGKLMRVKPRQRPFFDFFYYGYGHSRKRALLVYRPFGVWTQSRTSWSAIGDVHDDLRVLSELGYRTDVVDSNDASFVPRRSYDLFIGNEGSCNWKKIHELLPPETVRVFISMTAYYKFQNKVEELREREVFLKRGVHLGCERYFEADDDFALTHADGVILMSNEDGRATYPNSAGFYLINNASYGGDKLFDLSHKNFEDGRNGFLFLAGSGNLHKRLDMVLEAFAEMKDKHLYICTKLEDDFARLYSKELFEQPNIHYMGHIRLYSEAFYDLVRKCNAQVFVSVSEGSPGGVIDGMFQGLIPLVSRGANIDVEGVGYVIEPCTVEEIRRFVREVSASDAAWHSERCRMVQRAMAQRFSIERYRETLKRHIEDIVRSARR